MYLLAWLYGVTRRGDDVVGTARIGTRITKVSIILAIVFFALISGIQMGGLIFAGIPLFILFPALAIGIGLAVSTFAKAIANKGSTLLAYTTMAASLIGPSFAVLLFWWNQHTQEMLHQNERAAFQAGDLVGQIGNRVVRFPASPQLETVHRCKDHRRCYTKFQRSGDTLQKHATDGAGHVQFVELELIPVHGTCDGPTAPVNACLRQDKLDAWCKVRVELLESVWCQAKPRHRLVFRPVAENYVRHTEDQDWSYTETASLGTDYAGNLIEIECNTFRDEAILNNPGLSRFCRVKFSIAADVSATVFLNNFQSSDLRPQATNMLDYANDVWTRIHLQ